MFETVSFKLLRLNKYPKVEDFKTYLVFVTVLYEQKITLRSKKVVAPVQRITNKYISNRKRLNVRSIRPCL